MPAYGLRVHSIESSGSKLKVKERTWDKGVRLGTGDLFNLQAVD